MHEEFSLAYFFWLKRGSNGMPIFCIACMCAATILFLFHVDVVHDVATS